MEFEREMVRRRSSMRSRVGNNRTVGLVESANVRLYQDRLRHMYSAYLNICHDSNMDLARWPPESTYPPRNSLWGSRAAGRCCCNFRPWLFLIDIDSRYCPDVEEIPTLRYRRSSPHRPNMRCKYFESVWRGLRFLPCFRGQPRCCYLDFVEMQDRLS